MAGDHLYLSWIRRQACACCDAPGPSHAHHHTTGKTVLSRGGKAPAGLRRGVGQKADDTETMPLCLKCHGWLHDLRGFFSGYSANELRDWQDAKVEHYRALYEAELVARGEQIPTPGERVRAPVPGLLDSFDVEGAASAFLSEYEGKSGPQAHHDLCRLLRAAMRAVKEGRAA